MNAVIYEYPENGNWRTLFTAAIVEADSTKLPDRIAAAKKAIVLRARELFRTTGANFEEKQALDSAICLLKALHGTLNCRSIALHNDLKVRDGTVKIADT